MNKFKHILYTIGLLIICMIPGVIVLYIFSAFEVRLISWSLGIIFASIVSIIVIIIKKKKNNVKKTKRILNIGLAISIVLIVVQFVYILSFFMNNINNYKNKCNDEMYNETITANDTLFYECGSYVYSYSEFLHCINIYKDGEYIKTYYRDLYMAEYSKAYVVDGIFYVEAFVSIDNQSIYAYKDGEYYGRLLVGVSRLLGIEMVYVYDANDNCVIEHEDVYHDMYRPCLNKYIYFTYDKVYYSVFHRNTELIDREDNALDSFVINNGNIEATSFSLTSNDKVKIKNSSVVFAESSTTLKVKTNILTYFYPFNKILQLIVLIYSILQAFYLSRLENENKSNN